MIQPLNILTYKMTDKKLIPSLYGLRAISVLLVIAYHLENSRDQVSYPAFLKPILNGHLGVNIFFVISGFIITMLLKKEMDRTADISLSKFYTRRVLRIFPAYYFLLLVYFFLQVSGLIFLDRTDWFFSLTLLKQFFNPGGITGHLWTISAEEIFYIFFPVFFSWLYPKNKKLLNYLLIFITLAAVPAFRMIINRYVPTYPFNVFMRGDALAIGCLLALNYDSVKSIGKSYKSIGLMLILFEISYLTLQPGADLHFMQILFGSTGWSLIDNLAIAILLIISIEQKNSLWYWLLNSKPMIFIGTISYSMYLWQQIFTSTLDLGKINLLPFNLVFIFIASALSYSLIEKPFLRLKERFS
ncbi:MAG TPA: acyltransferase [Chitinophagaceae bacterium]|nr:acyltransferase [Chitinophagaceae bacterium]